MRDDEKVEVKDFGEKDFDSYQEYFKHCQATKLIVEATPEYLYSRSAIQAFKKIDQPIKFLFIYRDPAERMFSDYQFHRHKTKRFKGSFESYVDYQNGRFKGKKVKMGYYQTYLSKWIDAFGKDRILEMDFNDLKKDSSSFMRKLASNIGIDPEGFNQIDFHQKNKTVKIKNRKLHVWLINLSSKIPQSLVDLLSPVYYQLNSGAVPRKTKRDEEIIDALRKHYQEV